MEPSLRILLVEDDPAVADMYRYRLEVDGYEVSVAADGESALRMAADLTPDLIYLDLRLPGLDGFAVLEQVRGNPALKTTPVVILTNYSEPDMIARGQQLGALEFLIKAETSPAALSERMEKWLADEAVGPRA